MALLAIFFSAQWFTAVVTSQLIRDQFLTTQLTNL